MPYSYDTESAPLWVDSRRLDLDDQAEALRAAAPTRPAALEPQQPAAPWLGGDSGDQRRRDAIAAASQAPRIPRVHRLVGVTVPACAGECEQGRGRCASPQACIVRRMEPMEPMQQVEEAGHSLVWLLCLAVLLCLVPALVIGVNWADLVRLLAAIGGAL